MKIGEQAKLLKRYGSHSSGSICMVLGLEKEVAHVAFDLAVRRVGKHTTEVKREDLEQNYLNFQYGTSSRSTLQVFFVMTHQVS